MQCLRLVSEAPAYMYMYVYVYVQNSDAIFPNGLELLTYNR